MTYRQTAWSRAARALSAAILLTAAGCTAYGAGDKPGQPPFPTDIDPCASYCLVWVPPVYNEVPRVVPWKCGKELHEKVCTTKTTFEEVCVPGCYEKRQVPDQCRRYEFVQATPAREEWKRVDCPCAPGKCYKREITPPQYKVCEKTETEEGFKYCAFTPPQYDIVAKTKRCDQIESRYVPAEYGVIYEKQLFTPGHWEWQATYGCKDCRKTPCPTKTCLPIGDCAPVCPPPAKPCAPCGR